MALAANPVLQQIHELDKPFHDRLNDVLHGQEYLDCELNLRDSVWLVNYLDGVLDSGRVGDHSVSRKCLRELTTICRDKTILPASYTLPADQITIEDMPFAMGGFGDVYKGTLYGSDVCIKRIQSANPQAAARFLCREAVMWKYLEHPNILSLRGVTMNPPRLISDWMPNGNLSNYIGNNANADRLGLISDIVEGFKYLHSRDVIHGDIKGLNILVDNPVRARIADFGISIVTRNDNSLRPATDQSMIFTLRWAAPEVLQGGNPSKKSDVYSFAMVMIEVFTGAFPFNGRELPVTAAAIIGGERPPLVGHATFTPNLQELTQNCWRQDADERPEMSEIAQVLANIIH